MRSRSTRQSPGIVTARVLLASVFVVMGALRLVGAYQGLPTSGSTLVVSAVQLLLGMTIAAEWKVRWAAFAAMALLLADALLSHKFWTLDGGVRDAQLLHFMKNVSLAGGFLLLALVSGQRSRY